jgi:hypothetical protein
MRLGSPAERVAVAPRTDSNRAQPAGLLLPIVGVPAMMGRILLVAV